MPDAFAAAFAFTLWEEGVRLDHGDTGYVDNPDDPGGATNWGITQGVYSAWRARQGLAAQDVRAMTSDEAHAIYQAFWRDAQADRVAAAGRAGLALCHFDWAFNGGVARARYYLQAAVGATPDGVIGPQTLAACAAIPEAMAVTIYLTLRVAHHRMRAAVEPERHRALLLEAGIPARFLPTPNATQRQFLRTWLTRCRHCARQTGAALPPSLQES